MHIILNIIVVPVWGMVGQLENTKVAFQLIHKNTFLGDAVSYLTWLRLSVVIVSGTLRIFARVSYGMNKNVYCKHESNACGFFFRIFSFFNNFVTSKPYGTLVSARFVYYMILDMRIELGRSVVPVKRIRSYSHKVTCT